MMKFLASLLAWCSCLRGSDESDPMHKVTVTEPEGTPVHTTDTINTSQGNDPETAFIATFSIDRFSNSKFQDENIKASLHKILLRYDLVVIQEVQDGKEFIHEFVDELVKLTGKSFKYVLGESAGRKSKKNQILILYRDSLFTFMESYQYLDEHDVFEREPLVTKFRSKKFGIEEFAIIGVDLYYQSVQEEINQLANVHQDMKHKWGDIPLLIMGNFMTGGSHISKARLRETNLKQDADYVWLIENIDTTVLKNEYTYDRIIAYGGIEHHCIADSAQAYRFDEEFGLEMGEAKRISDHYPVHIQLGTKQTREEKKDERSDERGVELETSEM